MPNINTLTFVKIYLMCVYEFLVSVYCLCLSFTVHSHQPLPSTAQSTESSLLSDVLNRFRSVASDEAADATSSFSVQHADKTAALRELEIAENGPQVFGCVRYRVFYSSSLKFLFGIVL